MLHSAQPIRTVEDVKDVKLHVQTRFAGEAMRALGAQPVPMPLGQLPIAITAHVVDGCVDPWHLVPPLRLNDTLKMHTEFSDFSVSSTTFVLVMNQGVYDHLPRELKAVFDNNSGQPVAGLAGAMWDLQASAVADMAGQSGDTIVTLLPDAVAHWRKATGSVVDIWLKEMKEQKVDGNKLLTSARGLLAKYATLPEPQPAQTPAPAEQQAVTDQQPHPEAKPAAPTRAAPPLPRPPQNLRRHLRYQLRGSRPIRRRQQRQRRRPRPRLHLLRSPSRRRRSHPRSRQRRPRPPLRPHHRRRQSRRP